MELDNALIRQKNHILGLINDEKYGEAILLLNFSEDLWATCTYAYKTRELRDRICNELRAKQGVCAHWKQHEKWKKLAEKVYA
jgi:hypothetical protein